MSCIVLHPRCCHAGRPGTSAAAPPVPHALVPSRTCLCRPGWDPLVHAQDNMERLGLVADVNKVAGGARKRPDPISLAAAAADPAALDAAAAEPADDELRVALGKARSSGRAPPKRLTVRQRGIVERLLAVHGDDVAAMARDTKLNAMQHSEGQLRAMIASFRHWAPGSGVDFRVPNKRLWTR